MVTYAVRSSINFRRNFFAVVVWLKSENVAGTAGMIQEGIAVDPLLARAGWNLAMLVWCGRRATTLVAAGHKVHKFKTKKHLDPGSKALPGRRESWDDEKAVSNHLFIYEHKLNLIRLCNVIWIRRN
ncbi:hypothetical protein EGC78_20900 [Shewanella frigidimarina]|nr:hypothetical protein EGC78_20900 [Shewanella frigidimarina]